MKNKESRAKRRMKEDRSKRTPEALLPYQQRWMADNAKVKLYEKSRRIGISWAEAGEDALLAARDSGMDVWYVGYNKDMALEFISDASDWARYYSQAASKIEEFVFEDEKKDIQAFRIRFASGHKIVALSSRPANLRGKQGKIVIDEAAFHDDLSGLMKAAMAMLMWGGRVVVISTHFGDDNHFNELINDIRAGKKPYSLHRTTLDDALSEGLYERICLRLEKDWSQKEEEGWRRELIDFYGEDAGEELFCIPSRGSGVYLSRALIESCMSDDIPAVRWNCPEGFMGYAEEIRTAETNDWCRENILPLLKNLNGNYPTYFGEDFGRTGDLTVIIPLEEQPNLVYLPPFVLELRNTPFEAQKQVLYYLCDRLPQFRGGALDARGNGQYLAEVAAQKYGEDRIAQVMLGSSWYLENMPRYKAAFEDRTIRLPRDGDILDDHRAVRMEKGIAKVPDSLRSKGRDGKQRHGDSAIAGAMAIYAANTMTGGPIEYESTGRKRSFRQTDNYLGG